MKKHKITKVFALLLSFSLLFQQTGFAQVATLELNLPSKISRMTGAIAFERFRPLHLRYISYDNLNNNFKLLLDRGDLPAARDNTLETASRDLLVYFLTGVTLPNDTFWVNLRPDAEDNVIDDDLARTDVGKILLEADLQLKKDAASFTSPKTPEGKEYWDKLYRKASELYGSSEVTIPTLTRPWIVPGDIIIRESTTSAYIYKATLKVMLEEDYLKNSKAYNFTDDRARELNEYSSQLIRELVIPKLTREVNNAKRYSALRQVYYSLILAQWFKVRYIGKDNPYAKLIDRKDLSNLTSKTPWSKTPYFNAYKKSFSEGEYKMQESTYGSGGQVIRSYFSGGITPMAPAGSPFAGDLTKLPGAKDNTAILTGSGEPAVGRQNIAVVADAAGIIVKDLRQDEERIKAAVVQSGVKEADLNNASLGLALAAVQAQELSENRILSPEEIVNTYNELKELSNEPNAEAQPQEQAPAANLLTGKYLLSKVEERHPNDPEGWRLDWLADCRSNGVIFNSAADAIQDYENVTRKWSEHPITRPKGMARLGKAKAEPAPLDIAGPVRVGWKGSKRQDVSSPDNQKLFNLLLDINARNDAKAIQSREEAARVIAYLVAKGEMDNDKAIKALGGSLDIFVGDLSDNYARFSKAAKPKRGNLLELIMADMVIIKYLADILLPSDRALDIINNMYRLATNEYLKGKLSELIGSIEGWDAYNKWAGLQKGASTSKFTKDRLSTQGGFIFTGGRGAEAVSEDAGSGRGVSRETAMALNGALNSKITAEVKAAANELAKIVLDRDIDMGIRRAAYRDLKFAGAGKGNKNVKKALSDIDKAIFPGEVKPLAVLINDLNNAKPYERSRAARVIRDLVEIGEINEVDAGGALGFKAIDTLTNDMGSSSSQMSSASTLALRLLTESGTIDEEMICSASGVAIFTALVTHSFDKNQNVRDESRKAMWELIKQNALTGKSVESMLAKHEKLNKEQIRAMIASYIKARRPKDKDDDLHGYIDQVVERVQNSKQRVTAPKTVIKYYEELAGPVIPESAKKSSQPSGMAWLGWFSSGNKDERPEMAKSVRNAITMLAFGNIPAGTSDEILHEVIKVLGQDSSVDAKNSVPFQLAGIVNSADRKWMLRAEAALELLKMTEKRGSSGLEKAATDIADLLYENIGSEDLALRKDLVDRLAALAKDKKDRIAARILYRAMGVLPQLLDNDRVKEQQLLGHLRALLPELVIEDFEEDDETGDQSELVLMRNYLEMFKDYDYRWTGKEPLPPKVIFNLGLTWADMALKKAQAAGITNRKVIIARDARKIEPELMQELIRALRWRGLDVVDITADGPNAVTSYSWAVQQENPLMSIFVTASHLSRPKDVFVRGFKVSIMKGAGGAVQSLTTREIKNDSKKIVMGYDANPDSKGANRGRGTSYKKVSVVENTVRMNALIGRIAAQGGSLYDLARQISRADDPVSVLASGEQEVGDTKPLKGMRVVIEGSHTPSGILAAKTYENLGAEVHLLHGDIQEVEGEHKADPAKEANLVDLKAEMGKTGADFGLAFDLDGDRGAMIVPKGAYKEGPGQEFEALPPDNLMVALLPYLIKELGYDPKITGRKPAVIRDVLGTYGVNDMAGGIGAEAFQTDAGYVFLMAKREELLSKRYIIPIFGERSGHCWLDVTGEKENPLAVSILFATLVKKAKFKDDSATSAIPFFEAYQEMGIPYSQSPRFQPLIHPDVLKKASLSKNNTSKWRFDPANPANKPESVVAALARDIGVFILEGEFKPGKEYSTPGGTLRVKEVILNKDSAEDGGLNRFIDIRFETQDGKFAGRFIFRGSTNDGTFACTYETPVLPKETPEDAQKRRLCVGGLVLDWLENNNYALISSERIAEDLGIDAQRADEEAKRWNLKPIEMDLLAYREYKEDAAAQQAASASGAKPASQYAKSVEDRLLALGKVVDRDKMREALNELGQLLRGKADAVAAQTLTAVVLSNIKLDRLARLEAIGNLRHALFPLPTVDREVENTNGKAMQAAVRGLRQIIHEGEDEFKALARADLRDAGFEAAEEEVAATSRADDPAQRIGGAVDQLKTIVYSTSASEADIKAALGSLGQFLCEQGNSDASELFADIALDNGLPGWVRQEAYDKLEEAFYLPSSDDPARDSNRKKAVRAATVGLQRIDRARNEGKEEVRGIPVAQEENAGPVFTGTVVVEEPAAVRNLTPLTLDQAIGVSKDLPGVTPERADECFQRFHDYLVDNNITTLAEARLAAIKEIPRILASLSSGMAGDEKGLVVKVPLTKEEIEKFIAVHRPGIKVEHLDLAVKRAQNKGLTKDDQEEVLGICDDVLADAGILRFGRVEEPEDLGIGAVAGRTPVPEGVRLPKERPSDMGGIDFRNLPIVTQAISNIQLTLHRMSLSKARSIDLDKEWQDIQAMVKARMAPSAERVKEYVQVLALKGGSEEQKEEVVSCIAQILRLDEEECCETDAGFKDILVLLESGRSVEEVQKVFAQAA